MLIIVVVVALILSGCGGKSPTEPTMVATPPATATPAPTPSPTPVPTPSPAPTTPAPNPLLSDPRFDRAFYRKFALNAFESPRALEPLRRFTQAPTIFLFRVDDSGVAIDSVSLDTTAAALINVAGSLTGSFGLAGLRLVTGADVPGPGTITVRWSSGIDPAACGRAAIGLNSITLFPKTPGCRCDGTPSIINPNVVRHELGHALGYYHTDSPDDLMWGLADARCDKGPSPREIFHARVAYSMPIGSLEPQ